MIVHVELWTICEKILHKYVLNLKREYFLNVVVLKLQNQCHIMLGLKVGTDSYHFTPLSG